MQIYSVLIKIWKLQIDLLYIKKNKKIKYRMRPRIPCPCCGAPLAPQVLPQTVVERQHCYAVQVEAVIVAAVVEFHSCTHHKKESLSFSRSRLPPVRSSSPAAETGGDLLSHALMSCRRRRCCCLVLASSWELFWNWNNPSLQLPRKKSLMQTFPLN